MACKLRACVQASQTKKKKPYFVLSAVNFIAPGFNTNEKKCLRGFCIPSNMKSTRMIMLNTCARSPENFQMDVRFSNYESP